MDRELEMRLKVLANLDDLQKLNAQIIAVHQKIAETAKVASDAGAKSSSAFAGIQGSMQNLINSISQGNISISTIFGSIKNSVANLGSSLGSLGPIAGAAGLAIAALAVVGAAVGGVLYEITRRVSETGTQIEIASKRTGVSVETLSSLKIATDTVNVSMDSLARGMAFLGRSVTTAVAKPTSEQARIFEALGVQVKDTQGKIRNISDILPDVATGFTHIESESLRSKTAIALFGRAGFEMLPFLVQGGDEIRSFQQKAKELGIVFDRDLAKSSKELEDNFKFLHGAVQGVEIVLGREFMPAVNDVVIGVTKWIVAHRQLIAQDIKGFVHGVGVAIGAIKDVIMAVIDTIKAFKDAFTSLYQAIVKWGSDSLTVIAQWAIKASDAIGKVTNKMAEWSKAHLGLGENQEKNRKILEALTGRTDLYQQSTEHATTQTKVLANSNTSAAEATAKHTDKLKEYNQTTQATTAVDYALERAFGKSGEAAAAHAKAIAELNTSIHEHIIMLQAELEGMGNTKEAQIKLTAAKQLAKGANAELVEKEMQLALIQSQVQEAFGTTADKLEKQIMEFGKTPLEIAKYEGAIALAKVANEGASQAILNNIKSMENQKEISLELSRLKEIQNAFLPEPDKLRIQANQDIEILQNAWKTANDPTIPIQQRQALLDQLSQMGIKSVTDETNAELALRQRAAAKELEIQKNLEDKVKLTLDDVVKAHQELGIEFTQNDISAILAAQLEKIKTDYDATVAGIKKSNLDPALKEGLISAATAKENLARLEAIRQAYITVLETSGKVTDAVKAGFLSWAENARNVGKQIEDYVISGLNKIQDGVVKMAQDVFHGQFKNILSDWKSLLSQMLNDFLALVVRIAEQKIVISLAASFGLSSGAQAGGIFSGLGSIFGGGAGANGALLGSSALAAGQTGLDVSSAGMGFLGSIGSIIGTIAPFAAAAAIAIPLIGGILDLFKKQPYVEFDVAHLQSTDLKRYATMADFLVAVADTSGEMAKKLVKGWEEHGAGVRTQPIRDAILKNVQDLLITPVQTAIDTLPKDIADKIKQAFLTTPIVYHGAQLTMNEVGDAISQAIQSFVSGQATAQIEAAMKDFWKTALVDMGVEAKKASDLIDAELKGFWSSKNQADIGKQIVAQFQAYVQAFNLASGNMTDTFQTAVNQLLSLAESLGFKGIPTMQEFSDKLKEMIANAQITPDVIAKFQQLHDAIISLNLALSQSILTISQAISALNAKIVALGGASVDISNQVQQSINQLQNLISQGGLTPEQMQQALQTMTGLVDEGVAAQEAAQAKVLKAEEASVQAQIDKLNALKTTITDTYNKEIAAAQTALDLANSYKQLNDSIKATLQGILTGSVTPMTPIEQVNLLQSQIQAAKAGLAGAKTDTAKQEYITQIQTLSQQLIQSAGTAFGVGSPAFQAIFTQVTKDLQSLINLTGAKSADIAELTKKIVDLNKQMNDKLAAIDKQIAADNAKLTALQAQETQLTGAAKAEAKAYYQFIETQYMAMLQKQIAQQAQIGTATTYTIDTGFTSLISVNNQMLTGINQIVKNTSAIGGCIPKFQHGGYVQRDTLAYLHGGEYVLPVGVGSRGRAGNSKVDINFSIDFKGADGLPPTPGSWADYFLQKVLAELDHGGKIREKIERLHRYAT